MVEKINNQNDDNKEQKPESSGFSPVPVPKTLASVDNRPAADINQPIIRHSPANPDQSTPTFSEKPLERRTFIKWLVVGWTAFAAVVSGYGTLLLRFLFPNV